MRGPVDFADGKTCAGGYLFTVRAFQTRFRRRALRAVERFCKNTGDRSFTDTARTGKNIGVRNFTASNRVRERAGNMLLTGYTGKTPRTIFAGENEERHRSCF